MNHYRRWALLLLALTPAWLSAAETGAVNAASAAAGVSAPAGVGAATGTDAAAAPIPPVVPPPGATAAADPTSRPPGGAPATATPAGTLPNDVARPAERSATTTGESAPNTLATLPPPRLSGAWQAIEVIVFDRPMVGLEPKGELLASDAPRTFPAALTSLDPAGEEGTVLYPADPRDTACHLRFGLPPMASPDADNQVPPAFTDSATTPRTEPASAESDAERSTAPPRADTGAEPALDVPPDPAAELRAALAEYEAGLVEQSLAWLPAGANGLAAAARRLEQQGGYRVLFHRTWIQNLARRSPTPTLLVQSERAAGGVSRLEGTLRVQRGRGTRFDAALWYRPAGADPADPTYIPISASRRLGNGEVVYVDHPKLGIVVRTVEVGIPAAIVDAWQALATTPPQAPELPGSAPASADRPAGAAPADGAPAGTAPAVSRPVE